MPASVKYFTSAMTGAPTVSRTAGTLIAMLDACLVDGFGLKSVDSVVVASGIATVSISTGHSFTPQSVALMAGATPAGLNGEKKVIAVTTNTFTFDATGISDQTATGTITTKLPGAGWTKAFTGTNKAVYRSSNPASTQSYLRIDDSHAEYARPTGYLTMSDVDTGTGGFSTVYFNRAQATTGNRNWWLAANDSFVMFGIDTHLSGTGYVLFAFGDIISRRSGDPYRFLISGSQYAATNWGNTDKGASSITYGGATAGCNMLSRSYTQIGSAVNVTTGGHFATGTNINSGAVANIQFPNGGDNSVIFNDGYILEGTNIRGRIPGAYICPQNVGSTLVNDYLLTDMPDLPGRNILWKTLGVSSPGGFGLDVTGPWA